jgi:hypothetical protein
MAKWNFEKIEEEIEKAEKEKRIPAVPVTTEKPLKLSGEETRRRYERG